MKVDLPPKIIRFVIASLILIVTGLALLFILIFTETALNVWEIISGYPWWFTALYVSGICSIATLGGLAIWKTIKPKQKKQPIEKIIPEKVTPKDVQKLQAQVQEAKEAGIDIQQAEAEIVELESRQEKQDLYMVLLGNISAGKSSLIKALIPDADAKIDVCGGTTTEIKQYQWQTPDDHTLHLIDMPGLHQTTQDNDESIREEALRAHLVVFLCEGDLTRDQYQEINTLLGFKKPLIMALNKIDLLTQEDIQTIKARLFEYFTDKNKIDIVSIQTGGIREVTLVHPDGHEELVNRPVPPHLDELSKAIDERLKESKQTLDQQRDKGFYYLTNKKLQTAVNDQRNEKADAIISTYTKKTVAGSIAAISPGSDILIQGYLGYSMVKELCVLYNVPVKEMDVHDFIKVASSHVGKTLPMMLALSGNILKAFPGLGTVGGSMLHAVAYGMIFESLGKAVAQSLHQQGSWQTKPVLSLFEEKLGEDMESRARKMARLAVSSFSHKKNGSTDS